MYINNWTTDFHTIMEPIKLVKKFLIKIRKNLNRYSSEDNSFL